MTVRICWVLPASLLLLGGCGGRTSEPNPKSERNGPTASEVEQSSPTPALKRSSENAVASQAKEAVGQAIPETKVLQERDSTGPRDWEQCEHSKVAETRVLAPVETIPLFDEYGGTVALSADGKRLVMSGCGKNDKPGLRRIVVYDIAAGKLLREFESEAPGLMPASISPDGHLAAYLDPASSLVVANVENGEVTREFKNDLLRAYYSDHIEFAPDGKSVWTHVQGLDIKSSLLGWRLDTGEPLQDLTVEGLTVLCFSMFPNSSRIAAGYQNGDVRVWNVGDQNSVQLAKGRKPEPEQETRRVSIRTISVSPDGEFVAACATDLQPRVWNVETKELIHELDVGGMEPSNGLGFDPSGKLVVCQGKWIKPDGKIDYYKCAMHVFDIQSGARLALLVLPKHPGEYCLVWGIDWGGAGKLLYVAMATGEICVFDLASLLG